MLKLKNKVKIILFLSSYIPLGVIFLIIDFDHKSELWFSNPVYSFILLITMFIILFFTYIIIKKIEKSSYLENYKIVSVQKADGEILTYIFTFMFPFINFPDEKRGFISIFMLLIIGIIYQSTDMIAINPTLLIIFRYHIFKVQYKKDYEDSEIRTSYMLTKKRFSDFALNKIIKTVIVNEDVHLIKEIK